MIKLNNKGFAVSTILYGILSLTIIILMLIFGIMKSSKDMNKDLVDSLEQGMNKCLLSEVNLENCYFNGENCNTSEYNDCIGKKVDMNKLYEVAEIGDFVSYDAGIWPSTKNISTNNLTFGGYRAGTSRNNTSKCLASSGLNGWRVLSIEENIVKLIHAGITECFYFDFSENNLGYNYRKIMTNVTSNKIIGEYPNEFKNWNNIYLNKDYATEVHLITKNEYEKWYNNGIENSTQDMINIGVDYLFSDVEDIDTSSLINIYDSNNKEIVTKNKGKYGIRPIVVLNENIKTSGSITNTYGIKEWILVK